MFSFSESEKTEIKSISQIIALLRSIDKTMIVDVTSVEEIYSIWIEISEWLLLARKGTDKMQSLNKEVIADKAPFSMDNPGGLISFKRKRQNQPISFREELVLTFILESMVAIKQSFESEKGFPHTMFTSRLNPFRVDIKVNNEITSQRAETRKKHNRYYSSKRKK